MDRLSQVLRSGSVSRLCLGNDDLGLGSTFVDLDREVRRFLRRSPVFQTRDQARVFRNKQISSAESGCCSSNCHWASHQPDRAATPRSATLIAVQPSTRTTHGSECFPCAPFCEPTTEVVVARTNLKVQARHISNHASNRVACN